MNLLLCKFNNTTDNYDLGPILNCYQGYFNFKVNKHDTLLYLDTKILKYYLNEGLEIKYRKYIFLFLKNNRIIDNLSYKLYNLNNICINRNKYINDKIIQSNDLDNLELMINLSYKILNDKNIFKIKDPNIIKLDDNFYANINLNRFLFLKRKDKIYKFNGIIVNYANSIKNKILTLMTIRDNGIENMINESNQVQDISWLDLISENIINETKKKWTSETQVEDVFPNMVALNENTIKESNLDLSKSLSNFEGLMKHTSKESNQVTCDSWNPEMQIEGLSSNSEKFMFDKSHENLSHQVESEVESDAELESSKANAMKESNISFYNIKTNCNLIITDKCNINLWEYNIKKYIPESNIFILNSKKELQNITNNDVLKLDFIIINVNFISSKYYKKYFNKYADLIKNDLYTSIINSLYDNLYNNNIGKEILNNLYIFKWNNIIYDDIEIIKNKDKHKFIHYLSSNIKYYLLNTCLDDSIFDYVINNSLWIPDEEIHEIVENCDVKNMEKTKFSRKNLTMCRRRSQRIPKQFSDISDNINKNILGEKKIIWTPSCHTFLQNPNAEKSTIPDSNNFYYFFKKELLITNNNQQSKIEYNFINLSLSSHEKEIYNFFTNLNIEVDEYGYNKQISLFLVNSYKYNFNNKTFNEIYKTYKHYYNNLIKNEETKLHNIKIFFKDKSDNQDYNDFINKYFNINIIYENCDNNIHNLIENIQNTINSYKLKIKYFKNIMDEFDNQEYTCPICIDNIDKNNFCIINCGHYFCRDCIRKYINIIEENNFECPICRNSFCIDNIYCPIIGNNKINVNNQVNDSVNDPVNDSVNDIVFGTKFNKINELINCDENNKIIIITQFKENIDIKNNIKGKENISFYNLFYKNKSIIEKNKSLFINDVKKSVLFCNYNDILQYNFNNLNTIIFIDYLMIDYLMINNNIFYQIKNNYLEKYLINNDNDIKFYFIYIQDTFEELVIDKYIK